MGETQISEWGQNIHIWTSQYKKQKIEMTALELERQKQQRSWDQSFF